MMSSSNPGGNPADEKALEQAQWTAAAFSHFTFLDSRGAMMVVDIQGVGQNYTDPQIHSADGKGFGKGNQGVQGMMMFRKVRLLLPSLTLVCVISQTRLQSHVCNAICKDMGISDNWSVEKKPSKK